MFNSQEKKGARATWPAMTDVWYCTSEMFGSEVGVFHDAIKYGSYFCEVTGGDPEKQIKLVIGTPICLSHNRQSAHAKEMYFYMGKTEKTWTDIDAFNKDYLARNPTYTVGCNNCWAYARALGTFLGFEVARLPNPNPAYNWFQIWPIFFSGEWKSF